MLCIYVYSLMFSTFVLLFKCCAAGLEFPISSEVVVIDSYGAHSDTLGVGRRHHFVYLSYFPHYKVGLYSQPSLAALLT